MTLWEYVAQRVGLAELCSLSSPQDFIADDHILLCPQMPPPPSGHRYLKENFSDLLPSAYLFPFTFWQLANCFRVILVLCCS